MKNPPILPPLSYACPKKWESLRAEGPRQRFCDQCQLHVQDLSAMSRPEGERFLSETKGHGCISYRVRPDGSMVTRTRWSGLERTWVILRRGVFTVLAMIAPVLIGACTDHRNVDCDRTGGTPAIVGDDKGAPDPHQHRAANDRVVGEILGNQ